MMLRVVAHDLRRWSPSVGGVGARTNATKNNAQPIIPAMPPAMLALCPARIELPLFAVVEAVRLSLFNCILRFRGDERNLDPIS